MAEVKYYLKKGQPMMTLMGTYALGILPVLLSSLGLVLTSDIQTREVAFANALRVAGK